MSNFESFSLIVPVAADKPQYASTIPFVFTPNSEGVMHCVKSIMGLNLEVFDNIFFTVLKKHVQAYDICILLELQFKRFGLKNAKIVVLEEPTATQAETIVRTIAAERIKGAIFVKDADCYFDAEVFPENGVAVYPLEKLDLVDPRNKSYVSVDDLHHVTNIIEKRVVSHLFNAGGYCFENVDNFVSEYEQHKNLGAIYISHLIYSMLLSGQSFRPINVHNYTDWNIR